MGRRRHDWLQVGLLLGVLMTAWWSTARHQGEITQQLTDVQRRLDRIEQRVDQLAAKRR